MFSFKPIKSLLSILLVAATLFGVIGSAGAQNQNFPTYSGNNGRNGHNPAPATDNPLLALLNWFYPGVNSTFTETQRSTKVNLVGIWFGPALANAAGGYFVAPSTGNAAKDGITGIGQIPPYNYAPCVPSDPNNLLAPMAGYSLSTFSWTFSSANGQLPAGVPGDYGLSVWTPVGPTTDVSGNLLYPERYFVYQVSYGTGQTAVYTIDQETARGGWNRIGGVNTLFHWDGVNPITVTLYNTVPRDSNGNLIGVGHSGNTLLDNPVTYANAVQLQPNLGTYIASPVVGTNPDATDPYPTRLVAAYNLPSPGTVANQTTNQNMGVVASFPFNGNSVNGVGTPVWTFSPALANTSGFVYTYPASAVSASSGWTINTSATPFYVGANYFSTPITDTSATTQAVTYAPTLADGTYAVYMWTPGSNQPGLTFGIVQVSVTENGTTTNYSVDLTQTNGYVQIGTRRFSNTAANPLVVQITNLNPAGVASPEAGKLAFANAVQFLGNTGLSINSTPVYATVKINTPSGPVTKAVNIVASEDGHIYCLDAKGRGDGTTDVYWVYPSLPNSAVAGYVDPNLTEGIDGTVTGGVATTIAEMPTGFNTTSAVVQEVPVGSGNYFLYIGSTNGRVYCIDMSGRGDYVTGTRTPGTTRRIWSYPDDFPAQSKASLLGSFTGSLAFNNNANGPTIFVPASQGRMYALDAAGTTATRTTTSKWVFPAMNQATLGAITTPSIDGPTGGTQNVYFGTTRPSNLGPGLLVSLNAETGALNWELNGTNLNGTQTVFDDFLAGPTTAFNNLLLDGSNYIFIGNSNRYVYCVRDDGTVIWQTNELNTTVSQPLLYTNISSLTNTQLISGSLTYENVPTVVVPTDDGHFYGLYAGASKINSVGTKLNWGYTADGDQILSGMAAGHQYMYGTDDHGYLYAFANTAFSGGSGPGSGGPGGTVTVPNDPASQAYGNARLAFLTQAQYQALQKAITNGVIDYNVFTNPSGFLSQTAFDFGETLYLFVYNFPATAASANQGTNTIANMINFTFSVEGNAQRSVPSESFQFTQNAPTGPGGSKLDGFAVVPYVLQPNGGVSLAPGNGVVSFSVQQISATTGQLTSIIANPTTQQRAFTLANPIGIALLPDPANSNYGLVRDSLGADTTSFANPASDQNAFNGSILTPISNGMIPGNMITSAGKVNHGAQGSMTYAVYDRSLMALVNGPDNGGITGLRAERDDLGWVGGYNAVHYPLSGPNSIYPLLNVLNSVEDYPVNFPNDSLDYPNIHHENVAVIKEPQGKTENPLFNPVTLEMPGNLFVEDAHGNLTTVPVGNVANRTAVPTTFETDINVPLYQPANTSTAPDTEAAPVQLDAGYAGQLRLFIDANNNGKLDTGPGRREAFRLFTIGSGVNVDQRIDVITPNVDLGSLSSGTGLLPSSSVTPSTVYSPWYIGDLTGSTAIQQAAMYQSFRALNVGNVNDPNVRVARAYNGVPWPLYDGANDSLSALDGSVFLFSDLDPWFSLTGPNNANILPGGETFIQKSRITDRSGTELLTNPRYKANYNTGHLGGLTDTLISPAQLSNAVLANPAPARVGAAIPIGFPVGAYTATLRVINDNNSNLSLDNNEAYSDPTMILNFNVTETRLTNSFSRNAVTNTSVPKVSGNNGTSFHTGTFGMADDLLSVPDILNSTIPFVDANVQPVAMRDLFGSLIAAWSSNRVASNNATLTSSTAQAYRILIANLIGTSPSNSNGPSPLHDLGFFKATSNSQWFSVTSPYPAGATLTNSGTLNPLFGVQTGERLIGAQAGEPDTVRFGNPALPSLGQVSPFDETQSFGQVFMAFTGYAQKQTPVGRGNIERIFLTTVTPNNNSTPTLGSPVAIVDEPGVSAGRLSVVQSSQTGASVFYTSGGASERHIAVSSIANNMVTPSLTVPLGTGFSSASDPSASYRLVDSNLANPLPSIELAFSGKLRGRSNSEIFLARIAAPNGVPTASGNNVVLNYFAPRTVEPLASTANKGEFRTLGVDWNPAFAWDIQASVNGSAAASILVPATPPIQDPQSGIYRVATTLGTAIVDPSVGIVRFTNTVPGKTVVLYATYQPRVLRVSVGQNAGFNQPSLVFEDHLVGSTNVGANNVMFDRYWYQNTQHVQLTNLSVRDARTYVSYNGGAIDSNNAGRPYYQTLRFGIQLPGPIPTLANGDVDFSQFGVNSVGPIQVDPSNGRVYFTSLDEDSQVTVKYNGVNTTYQVNYVVERPEAQVPLDAALAESGLMSFLDPFDPPAVGSRRPPLFWMFWSSNRGGSSDVYFQTIAPLLYPLATAGQ